MKEITITLTENELKLISMSLLDTYLIHDSKMDKTDEDKEILKQYDALDNKISAIRQSVKDNEHKYVVEFYDFSNGATSTIDNITAPSGYTAEDYIKDCEKNAPQEYMDMLYNGEITLIDVE